MSNEANQIIVFEYPLRRRLPFLFILGGTAFLYLVILALLLLTVTRFISGNMYFPGIGGPENFGTFLAFLILPTIMLLGGYSNNLAFPAVHVGPDGFRISRLFHTSPWFTWDDIHTIKVPSVIKDLPFHSRKGYGITLRGMEAGFFSFVGAFMLQSNKEGFVVTDGIEHYDELMGIFREKRPDLFDQPR